MLTLHSLKPIALQIEEAKPSSGLDYDLMVNRMILSAQGDSTTTEVERRAGKYRLV